MKDTVTVSLLIEGQFSGNGFPDWITHRANLLDLSGWVKVLDQNLIEVQVTGNHILVEALETACGLGPIDAHVESIEARPRQSTGSAAGFVVRT